MIDFYNKYHKKLIKDEGTVNSSEFCKFARDLKKALSKEGKIMA